MAQPSGRQDRLRVREEQQRRTYRRILAEVIAKDPELWFQEEVATREQERQHKLGLERAEQQRKSVADKEQERLDEFHSELEQETQRRLNAVQGETKDVPVVSPQGHKIRTRSRSPFHDRH